MALNYIEAGHDNPETIIFLHGAALGGWMWQLQLDNLSDIFHCIAPDLPQHGDSDGIYTQENAIQTVANLIRDKAHDGKAYVVGLSLGGLITLELLDKYPDRVQGAIVSAPPSGPFPGTGVLLFMLKYMLPMFKSNFVIRNTAKQIRLPEAFYEQFHHAQKTIPRSVLETISQEVHAHRLPEALAQSDVPLLAVVGEKEAGINFRVARDVVKLMPTAQGRVAPSVGHGWNGENPALFNQMIRDWFLSDSIPSELNLLTDS